MRSRRNFILTVLGGTLAAVALCPRSVRAEPSVDYQRDVRPILAEHCFRCHGPDAARRQSGLRLDQREGAVARLESGKTAIVPGDSGASELVRRIESNDSEVVMPPLETKRPLTKAQQRILRDWIDAGANYAEHWAYRRPVRPIPPPTRNPNWVRNAIDPFVLGKLESSQLDPSPEADRVTLIRRLSLDLTGLPPTIEEVDAFLAETSPDAYERLMDRLLASPHFGEKLAQDWLDLARFGDSSGYQDDGDRPNSPYRDYVIDAFNANMPFDQFTIENLAGDLIPNATLMQKVASGFNRLHRHNEEGGSDPEEFQVVYAVDRTNTTATTWMGLTFGCAQCHDHKYDPVSQREYYQLYAFFNSLKGEVVISKAASPPQIRVPAAGDQSKFNRLANELAATENRLQELRSSFTTAFDSWLKEHPGTETSKVNLPAKTGAVGGTIARSTHAALYVDDQLSGPLTLDHAIRASGRVSIPRSVNNIVDVGHVSAKDAKNFGLSLGMMAAEGPRFFASIVLPDGKRLVGGPIAGEHGVDYSFSYRYEPTGGADDPADTDLIGEGLLTLEIRRDDKSVGNATIDLTSAQRAAAVPLNAFGISFRSGGQADSPIELFIDDVEYTESKDGATRRREFDRDPGWKGDGNLSNGHSFGFDANAAIGVPELSVEQILAMPASKRSSRQIARLKEQFARERFPRLEVLRTQLADLNSQREALEKSAPLALIWEELPEPRPARILTRGDYQTPAETVDRDVPAIFPPLAKPINDSQSNSRNRLALARWLIRGDHPLTSRVVVNRLWKQCFGAGLVRTPEDFGVRGEPPTHPELLDWLAVEMSGQSAPDNPPSQLWDTKRLLRWIVSSSTYRQQSAFTPNLREVDPDNRLLARGARFRLSAEEIRDMALAVSGLLTRGIGGRSVYPYQPDHFYRDKEDDPGEWKWPLETGAELYRRGLYTFLRRTTPYPQYQTFDAPSRGECTVARSRTNTPLQAIVTMNDPIFVEATRVLAERVAMQKGTTNDRLIVAFRSVLSRIPSDREREILESLYRSSRERYVSDPRAAATAISHGKMPRLSDVDPTEVAAWASVAAALLNLDEAISRE